MPAAAGSITVTKYVRKQDLLVENWRNLWWNATEKVLMVVYVDDFEMAGEPGNCTRCWDMLADGIEFDSTTPLDRFLGKPYGNRRYCKR